MIVFCLIPVHNRLEQTRTCVTDLLSQDFDGSLEIVVIDDGSTDGTADYLARVVREATIDSRRVSVITGNGSWWWSKCINTAIIEIKSRMSCDDAILFLNDDVHLESEYIRQLLRSWTINGKSVVISQLVNAVVPNEEIDSPIKINANRLQISAQSEPRGSRLYSPSDVAPGRGTLYPSQPFLDGLLINDVRLPHYLADYEFSVRVRQRGWPIYCAHAAKVFTAKDWGNSKHRGGLRWRLFATESPDRLIAYWEFWRSASPKLGNFALTWRLLRYRVAPQILEVILRKLRS